MINRDEHPENFPTKTSLEVDDKKSTELDVFSAEQTLWHEITCD